MKKVFHVLTLLTCVFVFSQNPTPLKLSSFNSNKSPLFLTPLNAEPASFNVSIFDTNFFAKNNSISLYNPSMQLIDNYTVVRDGYYLNNIKLFSQYNIKGSQTDSLNPSGASNIKSALGIGILNYLFQSF